jgi:hypothetical protein
MDSKFTEDTLAAMRLATEWLGTISDIQIQTINAWPKVFLEEVKSHKVELDPDTHTVTYNLSLKPKKTISGCGSFDKINAGVHMVLGDSWRTVFKLKKVVCYTGVRRKAFVRQDPYSDGFGKGRGDLKL